MESIVMWVWFGGKSRNQKTNDKIKKEGGGRSQPGDHSLSSPAHQLTCYRGRTRGRSPAHQLVYLLKGQNQSQKPRPPGYLLKVTRSFA